MQTPLEPQQLETVYFLANLLESYRDETSESIVTNAECALYILFNTLSNSSPVGADIKETLTLKLKPFILWYLTDIMNDDITDYNKDHPDTPIQSYNPSQSDQYLREYASRSDGRYTYNGTVDTYLHSLHCIRFLITYLGM